MDIRYFDAHTHAHFPAYGDEGSGVVARALDAGVGMITVGTRKDTSEEAVRFAEKYENVWASIGLHPGHTIESFHNEDELGVPTENGFAPGESFDSDFFRKLSESERVVVVGECGLDYFHMTEDAEKREIQKERQKEEFVKQIQFAHDIQKPLMIHCRDAYSDLTELLVANYKLLRANQPGIIHFFSGNTDEAKKLLDMGFYFTFGGTITFPAKKNGTDYATIVKMMPMEKILSETDAPWVAPVPYRGKRNEPAYVVEVVKKLAEIKDVPPEVMREQILENVKKAFGLVF